MLPLVIQIERTEERVADTCAFAKSPVRVGRSSLSDLQLDESFVSQWHGVIRFDEQRTTYLDLGSTNPTLVDGCAVDRNVEIEVTETTDIRIGSLRLHLLRVAAPPELFGARRKSSFARSGSEAADNVAATMLLGAAVQAGNFFPKPAAAVRHERVLEPAPAPVASPDSPAPRPSEALNALRETPGAPSTSAASSDLRELHHAYQVSRERFFSEVRQRLEREPSEGREAAFDRLVGEFPEIAHEPQLRTTLGELGIGSWRTGVPDMADWLRRLTDGLFPPPGLHGEINVALAMERIGEVLEVFSRAFVGMRLAHSQFCDEMALDSPGEDAMLYTTKNAHAVLAYLLNPGAEGSNKVTDLSRALADFSVHQVALVSAVVEGARDMLNELSPNALTGRREKPGASFFGKLLGTDQKQLWARYVSIFDETLDEDRFTRKLFGRSFARKYYAITGAGNAGRTEPGQGGDP
jgi:predicted component of type VI protein secretion system